MSDHALRTHPEPFAAVADGRKRFELRLNDRDFGVGDTLLLQEYEPSLGYTGRECPVLVTYILEAGYGLPEDYVCMSVEREP